MGDFKEVKYYVMMPGRTVTTFRHWKTKGAPWRDRSEAPVALIDAFRDKDNLVVDRVRRCPNGSGFLCGEVVVRTPLSRMGAYLRRKAGKEDNN